MKLEICANSFLSAKNAQDAGAHRIELCKELSVGGLTPSYGLIRKVTKELTIETFVLIRPRSGNFNYSDTEFEVMMTDIQVCKELGCSGIVSGVLHADNTIDFIRTQELVEQAKPLPFTFHRAFDCVPNPKQAITQLIDFGVDRVLTSGQEPSAVKGINLLKQLNDLAKNNIIILPGSGINPKNITLFKAAGFQEIHSSASKPVQENSIETMFDTIQTESNKEIIKDILKQI